MSENKKTTAITKADETSFSDEVLKLAQCLMPVPPSKKVKELVASASANLDRKVIDRKLHETAWMAYDAVVGAANKATNRIYTNPGVGELLGTTIDLALRWQRFNAAVAGAFFSALWPAVGLPTANEVEAMRTDIRSMREELRDAVAERDTNQDFARELHEAVRHSLITEKDRPAAARKSEVHQVSVWSGWNGGNIMEISEDVGN